jgi:hypothetical protein
MSGLLIPQTVDKWSRSGFGALEFMEGRLVHGVEAYVPRRRPLIPVAYGFTDDLVGFFVKGIPSQAAIQEFLNAYEEVLECGELRRVLRPIRLVQIVCEPISCGKAGVIAINAKHKDFSEIVPFGEYEPLHIGTPFAEGDKFGDWLKTAFQCEPTPHHAHSADPQLHDWLSQNAQGRSERQFLKRRANKHRFTFLSLPIAGLTVRLAAEVVPGYGGIGIREARRF